MKFPKPRTLLENEYPDLDGDFPSIVKSIITTVKPAPNSEIDIYQDATIKYLKDQQRLKQQIELNNTIIGSNLYFIPMQINEDKSIIPCLVDTGCTHTIIHSSIAKKLKLKIEPCQLTLITANGSSDSAIKGTSHVFLHFLTEDIEQVTISTNVIISEQLNGLKAILGSEILLNPDKVEAITGTGLRIFEENTVKTIPMAKGLSESKFQTSMLNDIEKQIAPKHIKCSCKITIVSNNNIITLMSHNIKEDIMDETLPPSEELFNDNYELNHKLLDKTFTVYDGDFSQTPEKYKPKLMQLLLDFQDRFSKTKLDLETTDLYTASLPTFEGKKVNKPVRRLPNHKFHFALKAVKQLQNARVIEESDSTWRSNVVMVPKPTSSNEIRQNTKADN